MSSQKNTQLLKKLKKSYSWSGAFFSFIITLLITGLLMAVITAMLAYVVSSWADSQRERIAYLSERYEQGAMDDKQGQGVDPLPAYTIRSADGKTLYEYGTNTCGDTGLTVETDTTSGTREFLVYPDKEMSILSAKDGEVSLDINKFAHTMMTGESFSTLMSKGSMGIPLWIGVEMKSTDAMFIGKAILNINRLDTILLIAAAGVSVLIIVIAAVTLICRIISGAVNQRKLRLLIFRDEVTGGNNWTYFRIKGEQILRKNKYSRNRFAILDVVFVKYRNYCVCHSVQEGERMLQAVQTRIDSHLGTGELSGHYASANFAVLLKAGNEMALMERLRSLLPEFENIDPVHKIGFHIGICYIEPETDRNGNIVRRRLIDLERDYNNACAARATLDDTDDSAIAEFNEKLVEEQRWIDAVQARQETALANEEFVVYYQPKYNPSNDTLTGAEALIRWQSPEFGFVPPGRIIPIFEKNGFITEIDHYMIRHVARDQKAWHDAGLHCVPVSVNVSRAHFVEEDLAEQIRDIVDSEGTPHELIEIELTESAFFDDKKALRRTIDNLKAYGFAVSMDDFGSGYSSLNSLKDLPLDVLKLDAEFFRGNMEGDRGEIVISETIKLAQALHMRTVAEGVEIREQVDFLASQGCDMIQGYYYAKPMPKEEYEQRMKGE